jgi:tungstate transport system substrate-binding protein
MTERSDGEDEGLLLRHGFVVWAIAIAAILGMPGPSTLAAERFIVVQSTTSTQNSGLLDAILPAFTSESGIEVRVVAVGTGQAIKNARNGDGDVLLVHAKPAEETFVAEGFGVERHDLMYNDFVIVGPPDDPAGIKGTKDAVAAMREIARSQALFASRGDDSGTHKAELGLWRAAGVEVAAASGGWYRETGSGMGATLNTGLGMGAYILTDRATWISFGNKGAYRVAVEGDPKLINQYGVILVNPEKHPRVKAAAGQAFIDWLIGPAGQKAIAAFKIDGQQLFFPNGAARGGS